MKPLFERAVVRTAVPLLLALAALGVREATRATHVRPPRPPPAREFVPPPLFLLATAAPKVEQRLAVVTERGSARLSDAYGGEQRLRASGSLRIAADETLDEIELDLVPGDGPRSRGWPRDFTLHVRGLGAPSRATAAPGVRSATVRASVLFGGTSSDAELAIAWIRLPGGLVELHAVADLERAPGDLPGSGAGPMLRRENGCALGIDVVLRPER